MERTQINLTRRELDALKAEAKRLGISVSELLRRTIDEKMKKGEIPEVPG